MTSEARGREPRRLLLEPLGGWGPARFGDSREEVVAALGGPADAVREPAPGRGIVLWYLAEGVALHISQATGLALVECFEHTSATAELRTCISRTADGIGIGSTLDEVTAAWGTPSLVQGTAEEPALKYADRRCTLRLRDDRVVWLMLAAPRQPKAVP